MNFKMFKKTDRRIISTSVLLFLISISLLWQDAWIYRLVQTREINLEQIGDVVKTKNDVRRRFEVALSWLPIQNKSPIYQGDSIFTGPDSSVSIKTLTGEILTIKPNSFVVINQQRGSLNLNIGFGSIEGQFAKNKKFLISSNNNSTELNSDGGRVNIDAGGGSKLLLNVLAGEVKVRSQNGEGLFRTPDKVMISQKGVRDLAPAIVNPLSPLAGQHFKYHEEAPVLFTWSTSRKFSRMKIKIATDRELKNALVDSRVDDNSYSAYSLPKDIPLFWQVHAEGGISAVSSFALVGDRPPIPTTPKPGYQFFFDPKAPPELAGGKVDLKWELGSIATQFEVELSSSADLKRDLRSFKSKLQKLNVGFLPVGTYYWHVRSLEFAGEKWSPISSFKIAPEPSKSLSTPVPIIASENFLIPTKVHGLSPYQISKLSKSDLQRYIDQYPQLRWAAVTHANHYDLQISKSKDFKRLIVASSSTQPVFNWRNIEPGQYFWRVKAEHENSNDGIYTSTQPIVLAVEPPRPLSKSLIIDEVPDFFLLKATPPPLQIAWNPTVFTHFYELEFSSTSDFKKPTSFITAAAERKIQVDTPGVYFWRVRSLDQAQSPVSPFSPSYTLEFKRIFRDPVLSKNLIGVYPRQQDSILLVGKDKSEIEFRWSNAYREKNASYRLELSFNSTFDSVFFSTVTPNNFYSYKTPFAASVVYWRVRAETKTFTSEWTGANRFLVSYEDTPFDLEQSDKMFEARRRAEERQAQIMADYKDRVAQLRAPASSIQVQLDTPQFTTKVSEFTIESNLNLNLTPMQIAAQPFANFYEQVRSYPTIRWQKVPAAERYIVEIARDPQFQNTVVKVPCFDPYFTWETVRPGEFYYRVQAFNERYTQSARTPTEHMRVVVESPTPTSPDQFAEVLDEPRETWGPPNPFTLSWSPVAFARGYEVEFAEEASFKKPRVFHSVANSNQFSVSRMGLFYWRVKALNEKGLELGPFSPMRSVEVIQSQRGPASVGGLAGLFPLNRTMLFVGQGVMNLAFQWLNPSENGGNSRLEISTSPSFASLVATSTTKDQKAIISKELPEGKLYWRVRSGATTSNTYEFELRREREPYQPPTVARKLSSLKSSSRQK